MKNLSSSILKVVFIAIFAFSIQSINAQDKQKKEKKESREALIKKLVDSQDFVFVAETASPLRGSLRHLTQSYYDLRISKDSIVSYLPFFGRAYTAPIDPADIGFDFTSTDFVYTITENKKGGWDISIKPKDKINVSQLNLRVFQNGSASLNITSMNKEPISYDGYIMPTKKNKE